MLTLTGCNSNSATRSLRLVGLGLDGGGLGDGGLGDDGFDGLGLGGGRLGDLVLASGSLGTSDTLADFGVLRPGLFAGWLAGLRAHAGLVGDTGLTSILLLLGIGGIGRAHSRDFNGPRRKLCQGSRRVSFLPLWPREVEPSDVGDDKKQQRHNMQSR